MVCFGKRPFLDILIDHLHKFGCKRFILGTGYNADFIKKYYNLNKYPGREIIFSTENKPLGTGGAVRKAKKLILSKHFLVINGDTFSDFNLKNFVKFSKQKKAKVLMLLRKENNNKDYGFVVTNPKSEIESYSEKKSPKSEGFINSGVYLFSREVFSMMPKKSVFSLEYDFFPKIIGNGVYGYKGKGFFIDIGTPERYLVAKKYFLKRRDIN